MTFSEAQQEFQVRYYLWSISEFEKEREESFASLRSFKAGQPQKFHQFVQRLDADDQKIFGAGRLKKFHPNAVRALGENYSAEEQTLLLKFDEFHRAEVVSGSGIDTKMLSGKVKFASKRKLRKVLTAKFREAFGSQCLGLASVDEEPELQFKMKISGWIFDTFFDFGRRETFLDYHHSISSEAAFEYRGNQIPKMPMCNRISFCFWLGVCGQTQWKYLMDEDIEPVCQAAIMCCERFFAVAPKLLKGLEAEKIEGPQHAPWECQR